MIHTDTYSFIQFRTKAENCNCDLMPEVQELSELSFYVYSNANYNLYLCDVSGFILAEITRFDRGWFNSTFDLSTHLASQDCFRLMIKENNIEYFSNVFVYNCKSKHPLVEYRSDEKNDFFPFAHGKGNSLRLPVDLSKRSTRTEKEEYIDANGRINNPVIKRRDVYDLKTDYLPDDIHAKIEIMLMQEKIFIDDIEVVETGDYSIEYDDEIETDNGILLHRASTKVSSQNVAMMRNYI